MTEIKYCPSCKDTIAARQQDEMYGLKMRVHNQTISQTISKVGDTKKYRCTVCGAER